jgi:integrase
MVVRNIADLVDAPSVKCKARPTFSADELNKLLDSVKGHRWEPIYPLAAGTGLREGELLGLHWQDVSIENEIIQVQQAVHHLVGKGLVIVEPKSETSRRPVAMPEFAAEALAQQKVYQVQ